MTSNGSDNAAAAAVANDDDDGGSGGVLGARARWFNMSCIEFT